MPEALRGGKPRVDAKFAGRLQRGLALGAIVCGAVLLLGLPTVFILEGNGLADVHPILWVIIAIIVGLFLQPFFGWKRLVFLAAKIALVLLVIAGIFAMYR